MTTLGASWMEHRVGAPTDDPLGGDAAARFIAELFVPLRPTGADPERIGVYLATSDAGASASIALWQEAIAQGPGFADPRLFPWTLASSAAAHVALRLDARGPVHSLVGGGEAVVGAIEHALLDLADGRVETALVGALDAGIEQIRGACVGAGVVVRLARLGGIGSIAPAQSASDVRRAPLCAGAATPLLRLVCEAVDRGESVVIGSEEEGLLVVRGGSGAASGNMRDPRFV